ncbi:MAG TPA: CRISPR-associated helicase/endonuclease Cas3 [Ruminococcaceae bacterium]|jgi:CRISPR-associated endonuclease/helicase Cas3|nr:CRISPR-associated helicase/endonuclease Cas3 [Oscillospiraceae bacterium]
MVYIVDQMEEDVKMATEKPPAAHIREDGATQTIEEHLENVAELAAKFARPFHAESMAYQCGLAHDIGKYSEKFQQHIWNGGERTDHSTAGAKEIIKFCGIPAAYCIAGHHAGLLDGGGRFDSSETSGTLWGRLNKKISNSYGIYKKYIRLQKPELPPLTPLGHHGFTVSFFIRMLFSCLVDADFLDTERFMSGGKIKRESGCSIEGLLKKLDGFIEQNGWLNGRDGVNGKRSEILKTCIETGSKMEKGLFTLTVPTGGGKTVSSMAFALHHAAKHDMKRVIYVIPYCSIIEQTADIFSGIFGRENVLAHYSGAKHDDSKNEEMNQKRLAAENWDMPVVVTTAVQFFESLFSNRPSACRKLHSIADSVVIFDEAQTLPLQYLKPCVDAIAELIANYSATCVLCTATQPALQPLFDIYAPKLRPTEICPNTKELFDAFRRVHYEQLGKLSDEELANRLNACGQVLCIVSTRKQAKNVYGLLKGDGCFHLSTLMTPEHRRGVIKEIRERLKNGKPCRTVSTSLIEAGVDIDFPTVYRTYAGLDSEIQAGGRCNREGKRPAEESTVYLFRSEGRYKLPDSLKRPMREAYAVTYNKKDITAPEEIKAYFENLYRDTGSELDRNNIVGSFEDGIKNNLSFPFKTNAERFCIIENNTWTVLIPRDEKSSRMASQLEQRDFKPNKEFYRRMGQYCVNVYGNQFKELSPSLAVVDEKLAVLTVPNLYDSDTGLSITNDGGFGLFA